ncbi:MAG: phosphotriesterase [Lachnospiraceae bacterium]
MNSIMTVQGPILPAQLGFCQCHEHLLISKGVSFSVNPALCIDDFSKSLAEVNNYAQAGGRTLIDAQPGGCNRMAEGLLALSKASGINIIASTGFHKMQFYPTAHWIFEKTQAELTSIFLHELTVGMYTNSDIQFHPEYIPCCAGMLKTALDAEGLTPRYKTLFAAAADAAVRSGVPMQIHIESGSDPLSLLDFLEIHKVPMQRIILCHMDRAIADTGIHREALKRGCFLEFDTIGRFKYHSDLYEAGLFAEHMQAGFEDQLLFSLDTTRQRMKAYDPSAIGLDYILTTFLPILQAHGITPAQIKKIAHDNCVRIFQ